MRLQRLWTCVFVVLVSSAHFTATQNAGVRVTGHLLNVEGAPFSDSISKAGLRLGSVLAGVSNIGADGSFEFSNVSPGNYSLSIYRPGFALSPIVPVRVANTEVRNIEMTVPRPKQVSGQMTLDGVGPLPQIRLALKPVKDPTADPAIKALSPTGFVTNESIPGFVPISPTAYLDPRPDGTFVARIPDGDWKVSITSELPVGYAIKALTYGDADILRGPLKVRMSEDAAIRLVVTNSTIRLSKVYGRITGLSPAIIARGPISITFRGPMSTTAPGPVPAEPRTTNLRADGTFEVDEVLAGDYSVLVTGLDNLALATAKLSVAKADIRDFEIEIRRKEIRGQVFVEGGGPMPPKLSLGFRTLQESSQIVGGTLPVTVEIRPLPDGTFTAILPEEESLANNGSSTPCGYKLKSMIYGATDVLRAPLKVLKAYSSELQIILTFSECVKR